MTGRRLIDADALVRRCGGWYTEEGTEDGFIGTLKSLIDDEPTVDAIPVVWLNWIKELMMRQSHSGAAACMLARVIEMWRKECQEGNKEEENGKADRCRRTVPRNVFP